MGDDFVSYGMSRSPDGLDPRRDEGKEIFAAGAKIFWFR